MKDPKGHGSDAHQSGVADAGRQASYNAAKDAQTKLYNAWSEAGKAMDAFPRSPNGLTTDAARATPEWRQAKARLDSAFNAYRNFNGVFTRAYKSEIKADRTAKRAR